MEYAIVLLPLFGAITAGFFGKNLGNKFSQIIPSIFVSISAILSFYIFYEVCVFLPFSPYNETASSPKAFIKKWPDKKFVIGRS